MPTLIPRAVAWTAALLPAFALAGPLTLDQALDLAVRHSEAARAARAGVTSATEAATAAGQLPDPTLRVGVENLPVTGSDRFSTTRDSMTMKRAGIGQEWLSTEKRAARHALAEAMVGRESVAVKIAVAETRLQTALAYYDAYFAGEALKLTTLMEHHAHEELEAATGRLASAGAGSAEVLALTTARGLAEDESYEVRQQQAAAKVALERWVGVSTDELAPPGVPASVTVQAYVAAHPTVQAMQRDIEVARKEAAAVAMNRHPNWTWELSYGQRTGFSDMVSFGVSIPLPVATAARQDRDTASRLAIVGKAEAALTEATRAVSAEYRALTTDVQRLTERIARYRTSVLVPTQQRTAAATAAYRSNQAALVTLFEARHAEVDAQRKLLALERELAKTQAQLAFKPLVEGAEP